MSGGLTFENDSILARIRNTDWAIDLKMMPMVTLIHTCGLKLARTRQKWRKAPQSTQNKDLMNLKWDALYVLVKALQQ
ncbi:hypothetical protein ECZU31_17940 [Escherichia coli]|nr:hypothetical protein ECZU31_17940 [Escherichia coli]